MANSIELRFSQINETPARTTASVAVYLLQDLGLDVDGNQQWAYTLLVRSDYQNPFTVNLDAGITKAGIVTKLKARLADTNTKYSLGFSAGNQICTL